MKPIFLEYFWKHNFTNKWKNFGIWESEYRKDIALLPRKIANGILYTETRVRRLTS